MGALRPPNPQTAERGGANFGLCHDALRLSMLMAMIASAHRLLKKGRGQLWHTPKIRGAVFRARGLGGETPIKKIKPSLLN